MTTNFLSVTMDLPLLDASHTQNPTLCKPHTSLFHEREASKAHQCRSNCPRRFFLLCGWIMSRPVGQTHCLPSVCSSTSARVSFVRFSVAMQKTASTLCVLRGFLSSRCVGGRPGGSYTGPSVISQSRTCTGPPFSTSLPLILAESRSARPFVLPASTVTGLLSAASRPSLALCDHATGVGVLI